MTGRPSDPNLDVLSALLNDGVIAYPTEGVWGLGCLPTSEIAVQRILNIKRRHREQGLILVGSKIAHFDSYLEGLPNHKVTELGRTWPAPVTFLIPDNGFCPDWVKGNHSTVALRVSAHSVVQSLCNLVNGPIVSTSANRSGCAPALTEAAVRSVFGTEIDLIVSGELSGPEGPSEIRDLLLYTKFQKGKFNVM